MITITLIVTFSLVVIFLGLGVHAAYSQEGQDKETMMIPYDNVITEQNESQNVRPTIKIEEFEDGSVIVSTSGGGQRVASYDSIDSMFLQLKSVLDQMHLWDWNKQ
jgi:hypothetical protein